MPDLHALNESIDELKTRIHDVQRLLGDQEAARSDLALQVVFMQRVLRSLVGSHPRPHALRDEWTRETSEAFKVFGIDAISLNEADPMKRRIQSIFFEWNQAIRETALSP